MLYLKEMNLACEKQFVNFVNRYKSGCCDEKIPFGLNPDGLPYKDFYKQIERLRKEETCPSGWVPARYYLIYQDERVVGAINIRYKDNDFILNYAGHIGYGIAPWERNKGYATEALKQMLVKAKKLGMSKVLLTTDLDNTASQKVIIKNGGYFTETKNDKKFYWIDL